MSECRVCGGKVAGSLLCNACTGKLEKAIAELPADLRDLQLVATRQARGPLGLGLNRSGVQWDGPFEDGSLGDAAWEFAPGAADQIWAVANTVTTWVRHLCESRGIEPPAPVGTWHTERRLSIERNRWCWIFVPFFAPAASQPLGPLLGWLLTNLAAVRQDEAAAEIYDELTGLHAENDRWILGRSGMERFAGRCEAATVTFELGVDGELTPVAAICGANLFGHDEEADLRCQACGMRYQLAERLAEMQQRQINEQLARAHVIADALTTLELPLGRDLLRKWIERDEDRPAKQDGPACERCKHPTCESIRRPPIQARRTDEDGRPLYRVGDVRERLETVQAQRGLRLSA